MATAIAESELAQPVRRLRWRAGTAATRRRILREAVRLRWLVLVAAAVAAGVLGFVGSPGSAGDRLYQAWQLFVLNVNFAPGQRLPWTLQVARFLAPSVLGYATARAIVALFRRELEELRARWRRDHVVVLGLGGRGAVIVENFRASGECVVGVDVDPASAGIAKARSAGALVVVGDATADETLEKVAARRAKRVIAVCGGDSANAHVAARLLETSRADPDGYGPPAVSAHIADGDLYWLLMEGALRNHLDLFNTNEAGAAALLYQQPPWRDEGLEPPHALVVGLSSFGQAVASRIAYSWLRSGREGRIRLTLVDTAAQAVIAELRALHPCIDRVCELDPVAVDGRSPALDERVRALPAVDCAYVCMDDDAVALTTALRLSYHRPAYVRHVVARVAETDRGLARMASERQVELYPLAQETCTVASLERGVREQIARAVHEAYLEDRRRAGDPAPLAQSWDTPEEETRRKLRDANYRHADAMVTQLEAAGYRIGPLRDWDASPAPLDRGAVELMVRLEHERWRREQEDEKGLSYGEIRDELHHPDLVPWDALPDDRKQINYDLIEERPRILFEAGLELRRDA